jgi:glutaredoxin-like protein
MDNILDDNIKTQVRELFVGLEHGVEILFFGSQNQETCQYCADTEQMLTEIAELAELVNVRVYDIDTDAALARQYKIDSAPSFVIAGIEGEQLLDYGIRFKGIPAGHEFTSLINDLMIVSMRDSNLTPETREFLRALDQPIHLQVFVTPSCPYCPRAVVLAHQFAFESPMVEAEMVEAMEFPELANKFQVTGVPQTTINMGAGTMVGSGNEQNLVDEIRAALERSNGS